MKDRVAYRVAQLRELASLGVWSAKAAELLGMSKPRVYQLCCQYCISMPRPPRHNKPWHQELRDGFAKGLTPKQLGEQLGRSPDAIAVTLCKMGLTSGRRADPAKYRRPYQIPDELYPRYKELRQIGLTYEEAGYELGLLERPARAA